MPDPAFSYPSPFKPSREAEKAAKEAVKEIERKLREARDAKRGSVHYAAICSVCGEVLETWESQFDIPDETPTCVHCQ